MLSKVDLRDFFEINRRLYGDQGGGARPALLQALVQLLECTHVARVETFRDIIAVPGNPDVRR